MSSFCRLAFFVMLSIYVINRRGDNTHPCLTPDVTSNGFVVPLFVRIILLHLPYTLLHILIRWAFTQYCSNVFHNIFLSTLSSLCNSAKTQQNVLVISYSLPITFSVKLRLTNVSMFIEQTIIGSTKCAGQKYNLRLTSSLR
jgi:hypothetical protein